MSITFFNDYVDSLGIEPMTLLLLAPCSTSAFLSKINVQYEVHNLAFSISTIRQTTTTN